MTTYDQNTFWELIFSQDPDNIDEGMELLKSTHPQTIKKIFAEVGWKVMDEDALYERLEAHAYLTLYLLGVMHDFEVEWVVELYSFEVDDTELRRLPNLIGNLTNLTWLGLYKNKLTTLPESFENLTNLTWLGLYKNEFTTLPDCIGKLTSLEELNLDHNQLTTLPESIGNLTNLKSLYLESNELTNLPDPIESLIKLTNLDLGDNDFTILPEWIGNLANLTYLDLFKNEMTTSEQARIRALLPNCEIKF